MGSFGEDPNKGIDTSVGGLVWVRRRNGSWWPGRILGTDELPEGSVPTPRSGTPVKLLGREDASVDWYNLEKSKRVKAFRCGEYDACIEKAKASASSLSKKAVKYARREDAILHALELENARLGLDDQNLSTRANSPQDEQNPIEETPYSPRETQENEDTHEKSSSSNDDSDNDLELSQSGVSFEGPDHFDAVKDESKRWRTPNDSEDDGTEGVKRMKGLKDLGFGVESSLKRKRSQAAHVHEFLKKKSRRRTLTKVLECSAKMVSIPVFCESNESKKNNSDSTCENGLPLNAFKNDDDGSLVVKTKEEIGSMVESPDSESSEKLFDVPLVSEEKHSAGLSTLISGPSHKTALSSQSSHIETISLQNEEHNETGSTSSGTIDIHNITHSIDKGTSEWQLKGKRNSRPRKTDIDDEVNPHIDPTRGQPIAAIPVSQFRGWSWNAPQKSNADVAAPHRLLPYRQSRFTVNPKYDSSDFSLRHHVSPSGLYDVKVEMETSHRPQRVPYISLMSKLNRKPVIGHPIAVEVLDDGFCDDTHTQCYSSSSEFDYRGPHGRPTRRNGLLSKKIRKLSSLTGPHRHQREEQKPVIEKLKGPSIACVPLKIVFSRINAAFNNSMRPATRLAEISGV